MRTARGIQRCPACPSQVDLVGAEGMILPPGALRVLSPMRLRRFPAGGRTAFCIIVFSYAMGPLPSAVHAKRLLHNCLTVLACAFAHGDVRGRRHMAPQDPPGPVMVALRTVQEPLKTILEILSHLHP